MNRRLLELCLLAYPPTRREHDRAYLRDLALDLAEAHGFARQAGSLLLGGIKTRIDDRRRRGNARIATLARRAAVASFALIVFTVAASGLFGMAGGDGGTVQELERYACVYAEDPSSRREGRRVDGAHGCAQTMTLVAAREREGWNCTTRQRTGAGRRATSWECARGSAADAWPSL
jgi:hypothetical protein